MGLTKTEASIALQGVGMLRKSLERMTKNQFELPSILEMRREQVRQCVDFILKMEKILNATDTAETDKQAQKR